MKKQELISIEKTLVFNKKVLKTRVFDFI